MSEGFCAARRSDLPPLKRRRDDELDSEGSSRRSSCRWEGCRRPGRLENKGGIRHPFHPFCSSIHRDFYYADLYDMFQDGGTHVVKKPSGICKLSECDRPVWVVDSLTGEAYDFCRRRHFVKYKERMSEQWYLDGRLCNLNDCDNHVAVEIPKKIHEYCCNGHRYSAAGARGKQSAKRKLLAAGKGVCSLSEDTRIVQAAKTDCGEGPSRRDEIHQRSISQEAPQQGLQAKSDKERGYHVKVCMEAIENALMHLVNNPGDFEGADPDRLFCILPNVTDFHPFDKVTEFKGFRPLYCLHYIDSVEAQRSTIEGLQWKQTGGDHINIGTEKVITNYFLYKLSENSYGGQSEAYRTYLQFEQDKISKKVKPGTKNRWHLHQLSPSYEVIDRKSSPRIPVISKIFQNERGLPVCPPLNMANKNCEHVPVGTVSQATIHTERGMTSSNSSNASPPGEVLPGSETLHGGSSQSNKCEESDNIPSLHNTAMEVTVNTSNASVPVEVLGEGVFHIGAISICSKTSPPGGGLPPGEDSLQGASSYDIEDFLAMEDTLVPSQGMEVPENASNTEIPSDVEFESEEWGQGMELAEKASNAEVGFNQIWDSIFKNGELMRSSLCMDDYLSYEGHEGHGDGFRQMQ